MSDEPKRIPITGLISEEGARELARSGDMKACLDFMMAGMQRHDTAVQLSAIAALRLKKWTPGVSHQH